MDSNNLIESYEKYLKDEEKRCKQNLKDIRHNLENIQIYKQRYNRLYSSSGLKQRNESIDENNSFTNQLSFISLTEEEELNLNNAKQYFMMTDDPSNKEELIVQLFRSHPIESAIIYCNSIESVKNLTTFMSSEGFNVCNLAKRNMNQKKRMIEELNCDELHIEALITVKRVDTLRHISLFVNYEIPKSHQTYLNKVGSRQTIGYKYLVVNVITTNELKKLMSFGKHYKKEILSFPIDNSYK